METQLAEYYAQSVEMRDGAEYVTLVPDYIHEPAEVVTITIRTKEHQGFFHGGEYYYQQWIPARQYK